MAEIKEGILGGVNGTVGTVVGFMWRGRYYIRSKPSRSNKPATDKQIKCRSKFGVVSTFASKFKDFVNRHCPPALLNNKMASGKEQLISMLSKEGVVMIDGIPCIDVSAVILSIGPLPPAVIKKINILKTGRLKVAWDNSIVNLMTKGTDRLTLVAYHENTGETNEIESIGKREDKFVHFDLPKDWTDGNVHFWSVWKSVDGKLISTSAYHGIVAIGEIVTEEMNGSQTYSNTSVVEENDSVQNNSDAVITEEENGSRISSINDEKQDNSNNDTVDYSNTDRERKYIQVISKNTIGKKTEKPLIRSDSSQLNDNNLNYESRSILEALPPTDKNNEEEILDE